MNIWFRILAVLLAAGALFGFGYRQGWFAGDAAARADLEPRIVALNAEKVEAQRQASALREASRARADQQAAELAARDQRITTLQRSLDDEIRNRASAVRRALDGQLVRLLNQLTPSAGPWVRTVRPAPPPPEMLRTDDLPPLPPIRIDVRARLPPTTAPAPASSP